MGEADDLARFESVLRDRAHRLIGPGLRPVLDTSDLLQETLLIAVRRFAELSGRPARQVLAWLLKAMQLRLMSYVRDHRVELAGRREAVAADDPAAGGPSPALGRMIREEFRGLLLGMIEALPEAERRVILMLYHEKSTTAAVAADLGRSEGAVRALHQRAVRRLREKFGSPLP